jgi:hypothetical protein
MVKRILLSSILIGAAALLFSARTHPVSAQATRAPAGPGRTLLGGVASIIEADVIGAHYVYDDVYGPRTEVTLANMDETMQTASCAPLRGLAKP